MSRISEYLKGIKEELRHVIWLDKSKTIFYTIMVIVISVIIAYFLGIFDFIFSEALRRAIS